MVVSGVGRLGGAVDAAEPVGGTGERAFVLGQGGAWLSEFEKEITQELAQWHDTAGRHRMLVHRVFEIGGGAELSHRLVVPAFGLRQHRGRGPALRLDLVGPIFVLGFEQRVTGGRELVDLGLGAGDVAGARIPQGARERDHRRGPGKLSQAMAAGGNSSFAASAQFRRSTA